MRYRDTILITILAAGMAAGCGQSPAKAGKTDTSEPGAAAQAAHQGMPNDDIHGMVSNMPKDDVHRKAMGGMGEGMHGSIGVNTEVHLDPEVANAWSGVTLHVTDRKGGSEQDVAVPLGSEKAIPGTGLSVTVDTFIPDFVMGADGIGTRSEEPNNPAAHVTIVENGKTLFDGWLFQKMPNIHPFSHERYTVVLAGGIPAK